MWPLAFFILLLGNICKGSDICLSCLASNSTCRIVSGIYTKPQLPMGYNFITQIPEGVCNLTITEIKQSRNYLALRRVDGSFVLNGNWANNWSGDINLTWGAPFSYTRDDNNHMESIYLAGLLKEALDLMVIYLQPNPGIKYQYLVPSTVKVEYLDGEFLMGHTPGINSFQEDESSLPEEYHNVKHNHSESLDNKSDKRSTHPAFPYGNYLMKSELNVYPGDQSIKIRLKRKKKYVWKITGFTECSKYCGGGVRSSVVTCMREYNQMKVMDRKCSTIEKPLPQTVRCNLKPCFAEWEGGEWSECSVSCGEGVQVREILCRQKLSATLIMTVAEGACLTPPPTLLQRIRTCQKPPCFQNVQHVDTLSWLTGLWSQCSVTCGLGVRNRTVECPTNNCISTDRPTSESVCDMGPCSSSQHLLSGTLTAAWMYTEWAQQCSEICGSGIQTRKVYCSSDDLRHCRDPQPETSRACFSEKHCGAQWFTGPWGQCTVSCGKGQQSRSVLCLAKTQSRVSVLPEDDCLTMEKPPVDQICYKEPCSSEWYTTDWSQCSRSCDTGVQSREVRCLDQHQMNSSICEEDTRPSSYISCNTNRCSTTDMVSSATITGGISNPGYELINSELNDLDCNDQYHNCHLVVQARLCKYKYYHSSCCVSCRNKIHTSIVPD